MLRLFGTVRTSMVDDAFNYFKNAQTSEPQFILLNTDGGSFGDALAIYDQIKRFKSSSVICTGLCASAGALILQAATHRYTYPNTMFLAHPVSLSFEATTKPDPTDEMYAKQMNAKLDTLMSERMGKESWGNALKAGVFDVFTAKALGMVDDIYDQG